MERQFGEDLQFASKAYNAVVRSTLNHGTTTASYFATIDLDASLVLADVAEDLGQRAFVGKVCMYRSKCSRKISRIKRLPDSGINLKIFVKLISGENPILILIREESK